MPAAGESSLFGHMLKERRLASHLTQEALAEKAGISARTIADLERGIIRAPRRDTLELLADALGLTAEERREWDQLRSKLSLRTPSSSRRDSLPIPPNELIGRDREVNDLIYLLSQSATRLVTVTGPGGVGKTRIALAVGHRLSEQFSDGVYFIELALIRDSDLLLPSIARHLGIRDGDFESIRERLFRLLSKRDSLLILDNAEHLRGASADLAGLLARCPTLTMLVTSRAGLHIGAEHEFPITPLTFPELGEGSSGVHLEIYPAIQLFVQRAQQVRPSFRLTDANSVTVAHICACLDGLPLAIELAAARVKLLPPDLILSRLADRLGFLTDGLADSPDRHRTMRAAIAWSYELLEDADQRVFRRLSTFVGGWTLEAAEALTSSTNDILGSLARLANDHLIIQTPRPGDPVRFSMLETVREYGLEQLQARGEKETALLEHARHFLTLVERAEPELRGSNQREWLDRLASDQANLRAALEWMHRANAEPQLSLRMVGALTWFWETRGSVSEGRAWLARALERGSGEPSVTMKALIGSGWLAHIQQDSAAASRDLEAGLDLARSTGEQWWEAWVLHLMGRVAYFDGDADSADQYGYASLEIARKLDDLWIIAWDEHLFGLAAYIRDDLRTARRHYKRSLEIREAIDYPEGIGLVYGLLGVVSLREGDLSGALEQLRKGLEIAHRLGARWLAINWLANVALIAVYRNDANRAARLAGFVESLSDSIGAYPIPITNVSLQRGIQLAREELGDSEFREAYRIGQTLTMEEAIAEALF